MRVRLIIILAVFLLLISVPYLYAYMAAGPNHVFGGFLVNPLDGNTYLAKMYQGWSGQWRYTLPYSSEPGRGAYLFLFYITLGHLSRLLGLPAILVFHLTRLLAAGLMAWVLYHFLKVFIGSELENEPRRFETIYALALLGSGLGWLLFPFGVVTSDMWVAETYPFLSAYANPHFPLGLAILLGLLLISYHASTEAGRAGLKSGLLTALLALVLSVVAPFGVVVALVVLGGLLAVVLIKRFTQDRAEPDGMSAGGDRDSRVIWLAPPVMGLMVQIFWVFLGGAPVVLYDLYVASVDPVLAVWNAQNLTPSPPLWDLLVSLSPVLLVACLGAWSLARVKYSRQWLFLVWAACGLLLLYLPIGLQRRFMMGLFVPLVGLAALGLSWLRTKLSSRGARRAVSWLLLFSLPTNLILLLLAFFGIQTHAPLYYMTRGEYQALAWIESNTPPRALILAAPETGLFIPAHTGRRVIYGHPFETVNAQSEEEAVQGFYEGRTGLDRDAFLAARAVDFVFYGPRERQIGDLPQGPLLLEVYSMDDVQVFQVVHLAGGAER